MNELEKCMAGEWYDCHKITIGNKMNEIGMVKAVTGNQWSQH